MPVGNNLIVLIFVVCLVGQVLTAEENDSDAEVLAGHSYHGEAFNEGPRTKPFLMKGLGQAKFPISTDNSEAQEFFNQGIDQLHGFWYFEAERSFRQVSLLDPDCAMAYWGLTMANVNNEERATEFIKQAVEKSKLEDRDVTEREKLYVEALEAYYDEKTKDKKKRAEKFVKNLEKLILKYPDDIEAKAFLACQVWKNKGEGLDINCYVGVNSILDDVFEQNPEHPAHHYRIHLWDYENAEVALQSAAKCGPALPDIAHMWHMPGHIYSRLKRYEDAVYQQEASARVDHRNMIRDWVLPDQIHNFAHNNEWCIRNLIHVGRISDAVDLATNMISLPRHPKYNTLDENGSGRYGRQRLFQVFNTYEMWDDLINACESFVGEESEEVAANAKRLRFLGRAYFRTGQESAGKDIRQRLETMSEELAAEKEKLIAECRTKEDSAADRQGKFVAWAGNRIGWSQNVQRKFENNMRRAARAQKRKAIEEASKDVDDQINVVDRAIDEMLGHELVLQEQFLKAVKKLKAAGQVDAIYRAYLRHQGGETDEAIEAAKKYVEGHESEVQPKAMLTWLLWEAGLQDQAKESLLELAKISASMETDADFFARLDPVIQFAGDDFAWRRENELADDLGDRPDLETLGPFRWQPVAAPDWQLLDSDDQPVSLSQFDGKPVIVIFYLGHGCLHCAEQLQAFAPKMDEFLDSGIELVAISSDKREGLKKSIDSYGSEPLPIRLLANSELSVFKKYHAYDEFEEQPLHGTFLIDQHGKIRWQDISYEPFMDPDFLLAESERLLNQSTGMTSAQ